MSRGPIVAFVALVLILSAPGLVLAEMEEDSVTLGPGDSCVITISNDGGEDLWIEYEVRVVEGPNINVWFVPIQGLLEYNNLSTSSFTYYPLHSAEETAHAEETWAWDEVGVYYLIIDNAYNAAEGQNVTVEYTVTWEDYSLVSLFLFPIIIIAIVIIVVVIVIALLVAKREAAVREAKRVKTDIEEGPSIIIEEPPEPPEPYPEWVVRSSIEGTGSIDDDDAEGWDPGRDEPRDL